MRLLQTAAEAASRLPEEHPKAAGWQLQGPEGSTLPWSQRLTLQRKAGKAPRDLTVLPDPYQEPWSLCMGGNCRLRATPRAHGAEPDRSIHPRPRGPDTCPSSPSSGQGRIGAGFHQEM